MRYHGLFLLALSRRMSVALIIAGAVVASPAPALAASPSTSAMSMTFAFEPRIGTYANLDSRLESYGFAPVRSALLPTWGLRGRAFLTPNLFAGLSMSYGVRSSAGDLPTTTTFTESTASIGYRTSLGVFASLDAGYAVMTNSVASRTGGGAMVYGGPSAHPRLGFCAQLFEPFGWFVAITAGANLHLPVGPAHSNPLWEEGFRRSAISSVTVAIESGLGYRDSTR